MVDKKCTEGFFKKRKRNCIEGLVCHLKYFVRKEARVSLAVERGSESLLAETVKTRQVLHVWNNIVIHR